MISLGDESPQVSVEFKLDNIPRVVLVLLFLIDLYDDDDDDGVIPSSTCRELWMLLESRANGWTDGCDENDDFPFPPSTPPICLAQNDYLCVFFYSL